MVDDVWAAADLITPMAVRVAATLRLADHLTTGCRTPQALAAAAGADPEALARLMAHLVTAGVLAPAGAGASGDDPAHEDAAYELTPLGEQLRDDHPAGARAWLDLDGALGRAELSFAQLLHAVRTGEPGYPRQHGRPFWDDLAADPARGASFDALMGARLTADLPAVAAAYPWGTLHHVVDVGGGTGDLLIALLRAHPGLRGTLVDLPGPAARADQAIAAAGLGDRAAVHAGSFFDPLPAGAGGYVLSGVQHDWNDADATRILRRCAQAGGAVLLLDHFGVEDTAGDLRMLCYVGGRERTLGQLTALAAAAGLRPVSTRPAGTRTIAEFRPAPPAS